MLINPSDIKDVKKSPGVIQALGATSKGVLGTNEMVVIADGVNVFLDYVSKEFPTPKQDGSSSNRGGGHGSFNFFSTYEECMDVFRNKPSNLVDFDPTELDILDFNESGNDVEYNVTGDFIDIGRFLEGVPEAMGSMHNGKVRERRVRIIVNGSHASSTDHKNISKQSQRICRLIDGLEHSGFRSEVLAVQSGGSAHTEVTVKHFDEPLSIENIAVATHPEWLRRIEFRIDEWSETWTWGYGSSTLLDSKIDEMIKDNLNDEITIYFQASPTSSRSSQFDKLEKMLEEELSEPQPMNSLFVVKNNEIIARPF